MRGSLPGASDYVPVSSGEAGLLRNKYARSIDDFYISKFWDFKWYIEIKKRRQNKNIVVLASKGC